jgi:hypothetical protein
LAASSINKDVDEQAIRFRIKKTDSEKRQTLKNFALSSILIIENPIGKRQEK